MANKELIENVQRLKGIYDKVRAANQGKSTSDPEVWDLIDRARTAWNAAERELEIAEKGSAVQLAILAETHEKLESMSEKNNRSMADELLVVVNTAYAHEFAHRRPVGRPRKVEAPSLQEASAET